MDINRRLILFGNSTKLELWRLMTSYWTVQCSAKENITEYSVTLIGFAHVKTFTYKSHTWVASFFKCICQGNSKDCNLVGCRKSVALALLAVCSGSCREHLTIYFKLTEVPKWKSCAPSKRFQIRGCIELISRCMWEFSYFVPKNTSFVAPWCHIWL